MGRVSRRPGPAPIAIDYRPALVQREGVGRAVREWVRALYRVPEAPELALFAWTLARPAVETRELGLVDAARVHRRRLPHRLLERVLPALRLGVAELVGGARLVHQTQLRALPSGRAVQVATLWDCLWHGERTPWLARDEALAMERRARRLAASSVRIQVPTAHAAADVARLLDVSPERIDVVPLGAEHLLRWADSSEPRSEGDGYLLTVARIDARKNHLAVLHALERLARRGLSIPWVVAGPPGYGAEPFLEALARSPVQNAVRCVGAVPDPELAALYRGARVFAFPSLGEGFGLPPLEAMAFGVPVVASAGGALGEVLGQAALGVEPADPEALAEAIARLWTDPEEAALRAKAGRARAALYSWDHTARAGLASWRRALGEKSAADHHEPGQ
jgi:glycosyltransferase involved in cell wall biosynthesis